MKQQAKLNIVKTIHTIIWLFFNGVLGWLFFAVISNRIDKLVWIGLGLFAAEGIILMIFRNICPLTIIARRYSDSSKDNFDIYLPNWLARYNKLIYSGLPGAVFCILIYRLIKND